ncbi:testis-expressed protein 11 [Chiloscyllium plagiosum]|uniref:testis-expressed protein 11 n=1 Tax=Chiloscyllium plagiosum TaxID=36176 RepID=UPI001CB7DC11|nr:testis-expressed protein 11 [Chiloscyllium plagiosum]
MITNTGSALNCRNSRFPEIQEAAGDTGAVAESCVDSMFREVVMPHLKGLEEEKGWVIARQPKRNRQLIHESPVIPVTNLFSILAADGLAPAESVDIVKFPAFTNNLTVQEGRKYKGGAVVTGDSLIMGTDRRFWGCQCNSTLVCVRHVACKLVCLYDCAEPNEVTLQRQVLMFMKTGKSWLDYRKPLLADGFLDLALTSLEVLYAKLLAGYDGQSDINVLKNDVEKDLFKVHSYRAESAVIQCDHMNAVTCIQRCKDILLRIPKETGYLSLLCYNFGIDTYQQKKYEESAFWLSQSYDIGKIDKRYSPSSPVQAKVLRLLANVYLEWDVKQHQERALNAVILANQENPHPAGLFLKIKILLKGIFPDPVISAAVSDLLGKVSLDVCLEAAKLLLEHDRDKLSFEFLTTLSKQFETSHDIGKILLMHLMQLLQRGKDELAKQKIEDIIVGHYSGKRLSSDILTRFHIVLWEKATKNFEVQKCTEALQWYSYSLSFFSDGQLDQNLARLQRNRALCYLRLNHLEKAKEAVKAAEQIDPDNFFTQFNIYKIAILESDTQKAMEAIKAIGKLAEKLVECEHNIVTNRISVTDFLSLAAHFALENDQEDVARMAFEYLCEYSQDCSQLLTALRCLIRLVPSITGTDDQQTRFERLDSLKSYLKAAHEKLIVHMAEGKMTVELKSSEANWFRKIAWNLALQCENCPSRMRDFFTLSYQLSQMVSTDKAILIGQKTSLLMAAAASLEISRKSPSTSEQIASLTQAREHIQICWDIWTTLKTTVGGDVSKDPTETLLLLYEFEARAKLNDPKIEDVLERMLQLQKIEPKTLETLASLAMESPAHYPSVCKKALKIAFSLQKKQPDKDVIRCSKLLHSLIQISLPTGLTEIEPQVLEEVWWYYEEALMMIENSQEEYPEVEMLWLMTRAWNTGASLYSLGKYTEAEKWCGLGMRFLKHLGSLRASYESQVLDVMDLNSAVEDTSMIGLYAEILDRMDREKKVLPVEE